jgi:uncharacterized protein (DUF2267 family)
MDARRFTALVAEAVGADERRAERAIAATLETLAERIDRGEARHLAAHLPAELAPWIATHGGPQRFDVDEFLRRVAEREGVDAATAERDARAVFAALGQAVPPDELEDVAAQLPKDFAGLLPRGRYVESWSAPEFFDRVARRTGLGPAQAARATEVVLETLAKRIAGGEVDDLIARLPLALHEPLRRGSAATGGRPRRMPLDRFVARVAEREGVTPAAALAHTRAVFATLREAVGDDEFLDATAELPAEYTRTLVPAGRPSGDR